MKRNRPQANVTDAIDTLCINHGATSDNAEVRPENLRGLAERLWASVSQTAANGAVVAGLAEDQIELIRESHFPSTPFHGGVHDGVVDHLGISDSLHEWIPGTALLVIACLAVHKLRSGEPRSEVIAWVKEQAAMAGVANGVATIVSILTGHELVRLPAAMMARFWIARADVSGHANRQTQVARAVLRDRLGTQNPGVIVLATKPNRGGP